MVLFISLCIVQANVGFTCLKGQTFVLCLHGIKRSVCCCFNKVFLFKAR